MNATAGETISIPCSLRSVSGVRSALRRLCEDAGLSGEVTDDLIIAVNEATTNAVRYGCPGGEQVEVRWTQQNSCVQVEIRDRGVFRKRLPLPDLDDTHGRGIPLMIALMDEIHIREGTSKRPGTHVRLVKCGGR